MKRLAILVLCSFLFVACNNQVDYYRVTIKTADGIALYDEEKPYLKVDRFYQMGHVRARVYIQGSPEKTLFEASGTSLLILRELTKSIKPKGEKQ
jgi:hypothetical protein